VRIALGVEYDGTRFHGWQLQEGVRTVQGAVEKALASVADHPVRVHCAGRTDAGVHAVEQVIHFDTLSQRPLKAWVLGGNANLPDDVNILWAQEMTDDSFHARFSAIGRCYRYFILNRNSRSALLAGRATWVHRPLEVEPMQIAASSLLGTHDFSSYRALGCQAKSPVRTLHRLDVSRRGDLIELRVEANAFLHHMVRNLAGVLITIGKGDADTVWAQQILELKDRTRGGVTAPPDGLYFNRVNYPDQFALPHIAERHPLTE
jgi:tRNA pseudouridine38-40 synthase